MFYLTIVNKTYVTVTLGWHDSKAISRGILFTAESLSLLYLIFYLGLYVLGDDALIS